MVNNEWSSNCKDCERPEFQCACIPFIKTHPGLAGKNFLNTRVGGLCLSDDRTTLIDEYNDHTTFDRYWLEADIDATQIDKELVKYALRKLFDFYQTDGEGNIVFGNWDDFVKLINDEELAEEVEHVFPYKMSAFADFVKGLGL